MLDALNRGQARIALGNKSTKNVAQFGTAVVPKSGVQPPPPPRVDGSATGPSAAPAAPATSQPPSW